MVLQSPVEGASVQICALCVAAEPSFHRMAKVLSFFNGLGFRVLLRPRFRDLRSKTRAVFGNEPRDEILTSAANLKP